MNQGRQLIFARTALVLGSTFVLLLGLVVFLGWQINILKYISPDLPPMPHTGAISFFLIGVCGLFLSFHQLKITRFLSLIILVIPLERLAELYFAHDAALIEVFSKVAFQGRQIQMPLNAALSFIVIGVTLFLATFPYRYIYTCLMEFLTSCVIAVAALNLLGYLIDIKAEVSWHNIARIPFLSTVGFTVIGFSLFNYSFFISRSKEKTFQIGPTLGVMVGCIAMTFALWNAFVVQEDLSLKHVGQVQAQHLKIYMEEQVGDILKVFYRIKTRWEGSSEYSLKSFALDAKHDIEDFDGLVNLSLYDRQLHAITEFGKKEEFSLIPLFEKYGVQSSSETVVIPYPKNEMLFIVSPLLFNDKSQNMILVGEVDLEKIMQKFPRITNLDDYHVVISQGDTLIYQSDGADKKAKGFEAQTNLQFGSLELTLQLSLLKTAQDVKEGFLPLFILSSGVLLSILAASAAYFGETSLFRGRKLKIVLEEKEEALAMRQAILDSSVYGIISINEQGTITLMNKAAEKLLGYSAEEMIGKMTPEVFHDSKEVMKHLAELSKELHERLPLDFFSMLAKAKKSLADEVDLTYYRKDKTHFPGHLSLSAIKNAQQRITGFLGVIHDLTHEKEMEETRQMLLSVTTHELRSPLNAIKGSLTLIGTDATLSSEIHSLVEMAERNTERLLALINDLLDLQKIEAGKMEFHLASVEVHNLLKEAVESYQILAQQNDVILQLAQGSNVTVKGDRDRLVQVVTNFLSNAIKFSPPGSMVTIRSSISSGRVRITVEDQGPGICQEDQPRIFEKFFRGKAAGDKTKKGTGLGLAIAKSLVEQQGGVIGFDTTSKGSSFWFELPIEHL